MKRSLTTLLILFLSLASFAQEKGENVSQRYFDAKIREFVYRLELSDQQKEQFIPIYKKYNEEMRESVGERPRRDVRPATAEEAAALEKARIERQQTAQSIRLKYVDTFATVLTPDQLGRLYQVESDIQKKLMGRKNKRHNPKR